MARAESPGKPFIPVKPVPGSDRGGHGSTARRFPWPLLRLLRRLQRRAEGHQLASSPAPGTPRFSGTAASTAAVVIGGASLIARRQHLYRRWLAGDDPEVGGKCRVTRGQAFAACCRKRKTPGLPMGPSRGTTTLPPVDLDAAAPGFTPF